MRKLFYINIEFTKDTIVAVIIFTYEISKCAYSTIENHNLTMKTGEMFSII